MLQAIVAKMSRKYADAPADVPRMRRGLHKSLTRLGGPDGSVETTERMLGGVPCLDMRPHRPSAATPVLYVHGGGYNLGSAEAYHGIVSRMCVALGRRIIMPDYRLAPEHPFPAAIEDLKTAAEVMSAELACESVIVMGDSAGGGLALALGVRMSQSPTSPRARALVLYSPWVDLRCTSASYVTGAATDWIVRPQWLRTFAELYAGGRPAGDPEVSPVLADLRDLPPVLLEVGGLEILRDDARLLAERIDEAGGTLTFYEDPKGIHVWQIYLPWLPEARASMMRTRTFLATHVDG